MPEELRISYPPWVESVIDWRRSYVSPADRMDLAIRVASENVGRETGGPFGAAVFEADSGALVAVGMNLVAACQNSILHAEVVALMMAQARVGSYSLGTDGLPEHHLYTSCDPCAMCMGAALWGGVRRIVCAARRADALSLGFEEGPVFPETYRYLEERGVAIVRDVLREKAAGVMRAYEDRGGLIYNG